MKDQDYSRLVTVKEAMAMLRVGRTKLYELVNSGELTVVKFGRRSTRIKTESIDRLVANGIS